MPVPSKDAEALSVMTTMMKLKPTSDADMAAACDFTLRRVHRYRKEIEKDYLITSYKDGKVLFSIVKKRVKKKDT